MNKTLTKTVLLILLINIAAYPLIGKWELMDMKQSQSNSRGLGRLLIDKTSRIKPSELGHIDRFDREPYMMRNPLFGLHRLQLQNINNLDR